jgi:hypothetical protein
MVARLAWYLNLDADRELQNPTRYRPSSLGRERLAELIARMADLVSPDDLILDGSSGAAVQEHLTVQAFCPTPSALSQIRRWGLEPPAAPAFEILRAVNDRAFCAQLGHGLPDSCFARTLAEVERQLGQEVPGGQYVIKRAFSFAGREQKRVRQGALDAATRGFCRRSFERGEGLQIEPWVERLADFGRHGYLTRRGALLVGATREQRCDPAGRFCGMSRTSAQLSEAEDAALLAELSETARALTAAGYFGPFGIDGFRYRLPDGKLGFDARCEINARLTMGYPRALLLAGLSQDLPQ